MHFNGYSLHKTKLTLYTAFEQQRENVYQVRPSHDLCSMAMDLSKKPTQRLKVPMVHLSRMIESLPHLETLSIQYQDLTAQQYGQHPFDFMKFRHLHYLDISSCMIRQASIQALLRAIGPSLKTLKMLNIELNSLSWLCLSQFGKQLTCLHVSCNEPILLPSIRHVVLHLKKLQDFRLTRLRTGDINTIVHQLSPNTLTRLDLSPKMNIYPRTITHHRISTVHRRPKVQVSTVQERTRRSISSNKRHPPQVQQTIEQMQEEAYKSQAQQLPPQETQHAAIEHDLLFNDTSLRHLTQCQHLIELRLCFPKITANSLCQLFQSLPQIEVFELRQKREQQHESSDYLTGLMYCRALKELCLFGVFITPQTIDTMTQKQQNLSSLTICKGGMYIEKSVEKIVFSLPKLKLFCLGQIGEPIEWKQDIIKDQQNLTFYKHHQQWHCIQLNSI
ncbi:uncharacterized protein B0P05DRAFT_579074 [Gilbertella persicaria]|uniref:uncharacterized protein n=1 Tax=Gilbertella persicaria TaxID=101096 RepID=UPI00221EE96E|nr:uncharacterized protein B0P05DRAFT_579074 [Gilbertella persicaria]KAI8080115.1 hypothetical protein B0P05DRAFT_579074 [Gilbertella persicaria]